VAEIINTEDNWDRPYWTGRLSDF